MLINEYKMRLASPPCEPGSERWSAFAELRDDISEVMPYLNALWRGADYDHANRVLTCRFPSYSVALRPQEIAVSNVADRAEAERRLDDLVREINDVWERRANLTADTTRRPRPNALEVYKLLPHTNCGACGIKSCFAFAARLVAGEDDLADCTPLASPSWAESRRALQRMLHLETT